MMDHTRYERVVIDRHSFEGFHRCQSICALEIIPLHDGRTAVIATELPDNPGTSITNACERLAHRVCMEFAIDPCRLVWIEHYGYACPFKSDRPRGFVLVGWDILPAGHDRIFANPRWRPMKEAD